MLNVRHKKGLFVEMYLKIVAPCNVKELSINHVNSISDLQDKWWNAVYDFKIENIFLWKKSVSLFNQNKTNLF